MHIFRGICLTKTAILQFVKYPDTVCESWAGNSYNFCQSRDKANINFCSEDGRIARSSLEYSAVS